MMIDEPIDFCPEAAKLTDRERVNMVNMVKKQADKPGFPSLEEIRYLRYEATIRVREAEITRLYDALLKHGNHVDNCQQRGQLTPVPCSCGFRAIISVDHRRYGEESS